MVFTPLLLLLVVSCAIASALAAPPPPPPPIFVAIAPPQVSLEVDSSPSWTTPLSTSGYVDCDASISALPLHFPFPFPLPLPLPLAFALVSSSSTAPSTAPERRSTCNKITLRGDFDRSAVHGRAFGPAACICLEQGHLCARDMAAASGACAAGVRRVMQRAECVTSCCSMCVVNKAVRICSCAEVDRLCSI